MIYKEVLCRLWKTLENFLSELTQTEINLYFKGMIHAIPFLNTVPSSHVPLLFDDLAQCHSIIQ